MVDRVARNPYEVAVWGEKQALRNLDLLASASRILDATLEDYEHAVLQADRAAAAGLRCRRGERRVRRRGRSRGPRRRRRRRRRVRGVRT